MRRRSPKVSLRQRLKLTMETVESYERMLGEANVKNADGAFDLQAARYAAKHYRLRWIRTMIALGYAVLAVGLAILTG